MNRIVSIALFAALASTTAAPTLAADPKEDTVKARMGYYQLLKINAGQLFAMAKGDMPYDAKKAETAANNLKTLSTLNNGVLFIPGTSKEEMPGKTRALKKIWDTFPEIGKSGEAFKLAADGMAQDAGKGLSALRARAGKLGGSCKGCHDTYRADKF